jgi:hypothetical protein
VDHPSESKSYVDTRPGFYVYRIKLLKITIEIVDKHPLNMVDLSIVTLVYI